MWATLGFFILVFLMCTWFFFEYRKIKRYDERRSETERILRELRRK